MSMKKHFWIVFIVCGVFFVNVTRSYGEDSFKNPVMKLTHSPDLPGVGVPPERVDFHKKVGQNFTGKLSGRIDQDPKSHVEAVPGKIEWKLTDPANSTAANNQKYSITVTHSKGQLIHEDSPDWTYDITFHEAGYHAITFSVSVTFSTATPAGETVQRTTDFQSVTVAFSVTEPKDNEVWFSGTKNGVRDADNSIAAQFNLERSGSNLSKGLAVTHSVKKHYSFGANIREEEDGSLGANFAPNDKTAFSIVNVDEYQKPGEWLFLNTATGKLRDNPPVYYAGAQDSAELKILGAYESCGCKPAVKITIDGEEQIFLIGKTLTVGQNAVVGMPVPYVIKNVSCPKKEQHECDCNFPADNSMVYPIKFNDSVVFTVTIRRK